jgi:hypothetical protein
MGLVTAERLRLSFAGFGPRALTPLTRLWLTAFFSQRYSNSEDSAARRLRTVAPSSCRSAGNDMRARHLPQFLRADEKAR